MASPLSAVPRSTFTHHSKQLQHLRRHASSSTPFPPGLFKAPVQSHPSPHPLDPSPRHPNPTNPSPTPQASIIKPWKAITGAQEWQTSAYHYNPQTLKTLPAASRTTDKLLRDYATMVKSSNPGLSSAASSSARTAIAARRKSSEKMYVSGSTARDFGDRVVVNAFMFDEAEAVAGEKAKRMQAREKAGAERAGGRKRPVRTAVMGARRVGGGAQRANRDPGAQRVSGGGR
ncbi:hypothetical protein KC320_g7324 [Hortaea werneckii]|nr:hypothetical protein KC320_g7324 [Hortaea werneckii]